MEEILQQVSRHGAGLIGIRQERQAQATKGAALTAVDGVAAQGFRCARPPFQFRTDRGHGLPVEPDADLRSQHPLDATASQPERNTPLLEKRLHRFDKLFLRGGRIFCQRQIKQLTVRAYRRMPDSGQIVGQGGVIFRKTSRSGGLQDRQGDLPHRQLRRERQVAGQTVIE